MATNITLPVLEILPVTGHRDHAPAPVQSCSSPGGPGWHVVWYGYFLNLCCLWGRQFGQRLQEVVWMRPMNVTELADPIYMVNVASSTPVQPPGTLFHPTFMILFIPVHFENDSKMYFLIVLNWFCWRSWTCRIAAPYKFCVDWLIDWYFRK